MGKGTAIWLGAEWEFNNFEQQQLLVTLCRRLGGEEIARSSNPSVWFTVWEKDDKACVFLLNLFSGAQDVELSVKLKDGWRELGNVHLPAMTVRVIDL